MQGGRQARRQRRGFVIGLVALVPCVLLQIGGAAWIGIAQPDDIEGGALIFLVVLLGLGGLATAFGCWHLARKLRPPVARHLQLAVGSERVRRGDRVSATLSVSRTSSGARVELALVCTERYDVEQRVHNPNGADYDQRVTKEDDVHREAIPIDGPGPHRIDFTVPADQPFSYEGDCISAVWRVEARERRPRRTDLASHVPLQVAP